MRDTGSVRLINFVSDLEKGGETRDGALRASEVGHWHVWKRAPQRESQGEIRLPAQRRKIHHPVDYVECQNTYVRTRVRRFLTGAIGSRYNPCREGERTGGKVRACCGYGVWGPTTSITPEISAGTLE